MVESFGIATITELLNNIISRFVILSFQSLIFSLTSATNAVPCLCLLNSVAFLSCHLTSYVIATQEAAAAFRRLNLALDSTHKA